MYPSPREACPPSGDAGCSGVKVASYFRLICSIMQRLLAYLDRVNSSEWLAGCMRWLTPLFLPSSELCIYETYCSHEAQKAR